MPKSPLESFFDKVFEAAEEAAEDLVQEASKQARENMRRMSRQLDQATGSTRQRPLPQAKKRSTKGHEPGTRPTVTPPPTPTLYDILEVSSKASQETISATFRSLSTRFHPDNQKTGNEARYKDITAAWTILKNPEKRKRYDRENGLV